jgi:hypothetical protein
MDEKLFSKTIGGNTMDLDSLFNLATGVLGENAVFQGLHFSLPNGIIIIDSVIGHEYEGELVDGFLVDFVPFNELFTPTSYFAFDEAGIKYIVESFSQE